MATVKDLGIVSPVPNGNWIASQSYQKLSIVRSGNSTYIAKTDNSGIQPGVTSGWESYWMLLNEDGGIGEPGHQGIPGEGVPQGGLTGQVLVKESNDNYDAKWIPQSQIAAGRATNDGSGNNIEQTYETKADSEAKRTELQGQITENKNNISSNTESINRLKEIDSAVLKRLSNIENGIVPSPFVTDSTVAYIKAVPSNSLSYASLQKVGGMSYAGDFSGLRSAAVTEVRPKGKNLLSFSTGSDNQSGLYYTKQADGGIAVTGTPTSNSSTYLNTINVSGLAGFWIMSYGDFSNVRTRCILKYLNGTKTFTKDVKRTPFYFDLLETYPSALTAEIRIAQEEKNVAAGGTIYPMVSMDEPTEFVPYKEFANFPIPAEVQSLDGYGLGLSADINNNISWEENVKVVFNRQVKSFVISSADVTGVSFTYEDIIYYKVPKPTDALDYNKYSNHYLTDAEFSTTDWDDASNIGKTSGYASEKHYWFGFALGTTLEEAQQALTGKTIVYQLATPEVIDISDLITPDNIIEVTAGGSIWFVNQYNLAPASTVTYQTKEEAV